MTINEITERMGIKLDLQNDARAIIEAVDIFDRTVRDLNKENEQWFLDWQDNLNEISVR